MKRRSWKRIFWISVVLLIVLMCLTVVAWAMLNACGALLLAMLGHTEIHAIPFSAFMSNFVGSPMFYIYLADLIVILSSAVVLIATRKK